MKQVFFGKEKDNSNHNQPHTDNREILNLYIKFQIKQKPTKYHQTTNNEERKQKYKQNQDHPLCSY